MWGELLHDGYWARLRTRCNNIIRKIKYANAMQCFPDHLICPITTNLLEDPVIAPSGYTYEREDLRNWVDNNGVDPFTREPLSMNQVIPNRALQEAVKHYKNCYCLLYGR